MNKNFDDVLAEFEKKHGLKVGTPERVTGLTTGNLAIDWQTGVGGIPIGRITELYGYESSGKTTTALQTAAELQKDLIETNSEQRIVYLDFEHALDVDYAEDLGIDVGHHTFVPLQPNNLEQGAKVALDLIETGKVPLIVFDSVAAMAPLRLKDGEFDQATIQMHRAKLISALCQSSIDLLHVHRCAAIFINHRMESIEMTGRPGLPPRTTTPGGRGLKYYASLRLEFNVGAGIKDKMDDFLTGEEGRSLVGNAVQVKCIKNKVSEPGKIVDLRSRYGSGFDNAWSAYQVLLSRRLISKAGAWFNLSGKKVPTLTGGEDRLQFHGESDLLRRADTDPAWRSELIRLAVDAISTDDRTPIIVDEDDNE